MGNNRESVPFFIVGCPRSGTTLLQLLVDSHPHLAIPPESHIFVRFSKIFDYYGDLNKESNLRLFVSDLLGDYHIRDWNLGVSVEEFCNQLRDNSLRSIISLVFELYASNEGKIRWGDKTPQHMLHLEKIKEVFPEARFIHLIRDGRDVAVSSNRIFVGPPSILGIANEWRKYIFIFEEFKKKLADNDFIEVYYEDLVNKPENEVNKIFDFLGEDFIQIGKSVPNSTAKKYYLNTDSHMLSLQSPISKKKICGFKKVFDTRQIEIFESTAGDALRLHGYKLITSGSAEILSSERYRFFMQDKIYRYYRKYIRPKEINKAWILFRREIQFYWRTFIRSKRKFALHPLAKLNARSYSKVGVE